MGNSPSQLTPGMLNYAETAQWKAFLAQALADLRVALPGIVQSFDPATQTVSVQIAVREAVSTPSGPQNTPMPVINNVPIVLQRAGALCLTMPIQAGDECLLIFADNCFDLWWARGGVQNQFEIRRHNFWDCFCIPGPWSQPRVLSNYSTASAQLRTEDGTTVVDVGEGKITLTAPQLEINCSGQVNISGSQVVISSSGDDTEVDGKTFVTHQHTGVQSGGSDTGPVL